MRSFGRLAKLALVAIAVIGASTTIPRAVGATESVHPMMDIGLSCPATTASGTLEEVAKSGPLTRWITVTFARGAVTKIKLSSAPTGARGGSRILMNDIVVATPKNDQERELIASIVPIATRLKTEVCEGDADIRRRYFSALQQNEAQATVPVTQGDGDWLVILGTWPNWDRRILDRIVSLLENGIAAKVVYSEDFPSLTPGMTAVIFGPTSKQNAQDQLNSVRSVVSDAFIKRGR